MKQIRIVLLVLLLLFILIQFFRPSKNISNQVSAFDFSEAYKVPDEVQRMLRRACYDCHSNNTRYPWYFDIQPMGWFMASHIRHGKNNLNFSMFGNYTNHRQISKLKDMADQIRDDEMPISSYRMMHSEARLTQLQKQTLARWLSNTADSLRVSR